MRRLLQHTVRPVSSSGILSSAHFPEKNQGNFLILNTIAFLGIKQYTLAFDTETGDVNGTETDDLLVSNDPNFRPTDFEIGGDGALYVADWANAIIGHMQHNIRDPARDHAHGRIYRITVPGRPLQEHVDIDGRPLPELLVALESPVNGIRYRARVELSERDSAEVIAATEKWLQQFDPTSEADAHHMLEGLWVHQQHNVVNRDLLNLVLFSPVPHARIGAERVRQMWDYNAAAPFDFTTTRAVKYFREAGYEVVVFHAIGSGGRAMEQLMKDGVIGAVFDYALGEIADDVFGGLRAGGPERLTVAGSLGLPQVICPGGAEHLGLFVEPNTVPEKYRSHQHVFHSPVIFVPRLNCQEIVQVAEEICKRLQSTTGKAVFMIPLRGVGRYSIRGGPLHDPEADEAFFEALEAGLPPSVDVVEIDADAEDPAFVGEAVRRLIDMLEADG